VRKANNVYNEYIAQSFVPARSDDYITPIIDRRAIHKLATNYNKRLAESYEKLDNLLVQQKKTVRAYLRARDKYDADRKDIVSKLLSQFKSRTPKNYTKRCKPKSGLNSAEMELNIANRC
jgi:hypothetical protein